MSNTVDFHEIPPYEEDTRWQRLGTRLSGAAVIIGALLASIALATWDVEDRSLTHATDRPITNLLGFPGSAISDLLFQFFGIAAAALVLLPVIWGWQTLRLQRHTVLTKQWLSFIGITLIACGIAACFPSPETWPMPTGLGGIIGSGVIALPSLALRDNFGGIIPIIFAAVMAIGLPFLAKRAFSLPPERKKREPAHTPRVPRISNGEEEEEDEKSGLLSNLIGYGGHIAYSTKANLRNAISRHKARREAVPSHDLTMDDDEETTGSTSPFEALSQWKRKLIDDPAADDGLGDYLGQVDRQANADHAEPAFEEPAIHHEPARDYPPVDDDTLAYESEADPVISTAQPFGIAPPPAGVERATSTKTELRVAQPAAPAPKGKRVTTEAQPPLPTMKPIEDFDLPPLHLLTETPANNGDNALTNDQLAHNAQLLEGVLEDFGVKGEIVHIRPGPVVTLYELEPAPGIKSSRVIGLADDIARSMSAIAARVAVIPGKNAIGIELPNANRETVYLHESLSSKNFESSKGKLPLCLGKTIGGESVIADLAKMPHLLVAGTTGSGKSVAINTMILSLLFRFTPEQCKLIMIDPKMLELSIYDGIPHLLTPVVTDPKKAVVALKWTVREMEDRYRKMSKVGVRNIDGFNTRVKQAAAKNEPIVRTIQTGYDQETGEAIYEREELDLSPMPYIVVIIDEMADLMMVAGKDIEGAIQRLAQMARAAGIHVIMATQRPSVDVITGTIKANFPTRISFQVTSKIDSRTILGEMGAEQLLGMGDMLYMAGGGRIQRVHGPFVSDEEVEEVVTHLKDQGIPQYVGAVTEELEEDASADSGAGGGNVSDNADPYDQAVAIVLKDKKASTSYIQRRLGIGYNRAATIIERMEQEGVIGPANHAGKREILVGSDPEEDFAFRE